MRARAGALALALGAVPLVATACGVSARAGGESVAARQALGRRALIVSADLPGWAAVPGQPAPSGRRLNSELAACLGVPAGEVARPAEVRSQLFHRGAAAHVEDTVEIAASSAQAERIFALYDRARTPGCLGGALTATLASARRPGVRLGAVNVQRTLVVSESDSSIGYRLTLPLSVAGHRESVSADLVVLRVGRGDTFMYYGGAGARLEAALERRLNILVSQRLRAALTAAKA